jgi:CheY-like chemotaxis protein
MDLEMPVMDGLTCVRRIRELEAEGLIQNLPVIAVTANARGEQVIAAKKSGMVSLEEKKSSHFRLWRVLANNVEPK